MNRLKAADIHADLSRQAPLLAYQAMERPPQDRDAIPTPRQDELAKEAKQVELPVTVGYGPVPVDKKGEAPKVDDKKLEEARQAASPGPDQQQQPTQALQMPSFKAPGPLPGVERALGASYEDQAKASEEKGTAEANQYLELAKAHKAQADEARNFLDSKEKLYQDNDRETAEAEKDAASFKLDPGRHMRNRSTGQKIANAIGLILGGIGGGMTHTENPVIGIIQSKIQQDIDAQKDDLQNKNTRVSRLMQKGHSLREAMQLEYSNMQRIWAAQLDAKSAELQSPVAAAAAKQAAAQIRSQGILGMQQAHGEAIKQAKDGLEMALMQQNHFMQLAGQQAMLKAERGMPVGEDEGVLLPADRRVKVPGGWALANTKENADKVRTGRQGFADLDSALRDIEALKGQNALIPGGTLSRKGQEALQRYAAAAKALHDSSGVATTREEGLFEKGMGNPTDIFRTAEGTQELVDAARNAAAMHLAAVHNNMLVGGSGAARGFGQRKQNGG